MNNIQNASIEELQKEYSYHFKSIIYLSQSCLAATLFILISMQLKSTWLLYLNIGASVCFLMACILSGWVLIETKQEMLKKSNKEMRK